MILGSTTINRFGLGSGVVRRKYLGLNSLGQEPDREPEADYRYYRWTITERRGYSNSIQVGLFELTLSASRIAAMDSVTVTNPGGDSPPEGNNPEDAMVSAGYWQDMNFNATFESYTGSSVLLLDFGAAVEVDGYRWVTSPNSTERDPTSWTLERSNDLSTWQFVDVVIDATITETRGTQAYSNEITGDADAVNTVPAVVYQNGDGSFRKTSTGTWLVEDSISQEWYVNGSPTGQTGDEFEGVVEVGDTVTLVETAMPGSVTQSSNALTVFAWDTSVTLIDAGEYATEFPAYTYTPTLTAPVFDVTDYGADPTGAKDSTYSINLARAARNAAGSGTVYIPAGTYRCVARGTPASPRYCFPELTTGEIIEGDGPEDTILYFRAAENRDPASDTIFSRSGLFTTLSATNVIGSTPINNVTLRGFRATGNALPTNDAGLDEGGGSWTGWDTTNKPIGIFNVESTGWQIEDAEFDNWRGEHIYAGGDTELGTYTIERVVTRGCNASAISMGGFIVMDQVHVYACYNGTESFARSATQGSTITNCVIEPERGLPVGVDIGENGIVYLGFPDAQLTVTDTILGAAQYAGIFLSEGACNVTIARVTATDCDPVYAIHLYQYPSDTDAGNLNRWENWNISDCDFAADTRSIAAGIYSVGPIENLTVDDIRVTSNGANRINDFIRAPLIAPGSVTNCAINDSNPVYPHDTDRHEWTSNTVTGLFELGSVALNYDGAAVLTPMFLRPTWPRINISQLGEEQESRLAVVDPAYISLFPLGFPLEIRRAGAGSGVYGIEIQPDPTWNNLTRGYMIYTGGIPALTMAANGRFDLTTWTPNTVSVPTYTQDGSGRLSAGDISMRGQLEANLSPSVAHTFNTISGVAVGETISLVCNANVTITHTPGVIEMDTGVDHVGAGTLSATLHQDGTLLVGTHTFAEDAPIIGVRQTGDATDGVYGVDVVLVQDGDNPTASDGYYSIQRRLGVGSWAEIVQVPKASVTGTRKTYTYSDATVVRGEEYSYRARAVSPGTPDIVSRWSNTATKEVVEYTGALTVLTEVYKTASAQDLEIDIYRPNNALADRTAVICVHGGGWTSSSRAVHAAHCVHFASEGVVAFNIDYRLDDGTDDMEDQVRDVRAAIRWVRENATAYGVDPDDIVILGESAGGHLAGCAAFIDAFDDSGGNQAVSSRPDRAVLINPITYLPGLTWYEGNAAQVGATPVPDDTTQLTPASTGADLSLRLSPQLYANITPAPPVLFIHGDSDTVVPFAQSEDMHDLLVAATNTSTLETMVGSDHAFFLPGIGSTGEINATLAIIDAFLTPP